jgi:hypothetical protein
VNFITAPTSGTAVIFVSSLRSSLERIALKPLMASSRELIGVLLGPDLDDDVAFDERLSSIAVGKNES